jgi:hypothetical protein
VFNYRALPPKVTAALCVGLGDNSRIKKKFAGVQTDTQTALLAIIADRLGVLVWQNTADGSKGINKPKSIFDALVGKQEESSLRKYETGSDFSAAWEDILNGKEG